MKKYSRIMFAGPSGYGKTTLAKWLSDELEIPFLSGSMSDLIPSTKDITHQDMLARDFDTLYKEDFQVLNLRNKLFREEPQFISDRSYLDSAAYFIYKQAGKQARCEIDHFISLCSMLLTTQCDCLIFLNFVPELLSKWVTEDNNKRITNNYFQIEISSLMYTTLRLMDYKRDYFETTCNKGVESSLLESWIWPKKEALTYGMEIGHVHNLYGNTDVYIIDEPNLEIRKSLLNSYIIKR